MVLESGHLLSGCRAAYQPRNEEHEEHTYRNISRPLSYLKVSFPRVHFNPFETTPPRRAVSFHALTPPRAASISRTAIKQRNASSGRGNKLSSNTSGIFPCLFLPAANSRISEIALSAAVPRELPTRQFNFVGGISSATIVRFHGSIL